MHRNMTIDFRPRLRGVRLALAVGLLFACRGGENERGGAGASAAASATITPPVAWKFATPSSWTDRTESVRVEEAERGQRYPGARAVERFDYRPIDATIVPQTLLLITVYDSATWGKLRKEEGPPVGEVITAAKGNVYVASLPQSNPFAPGSADAKAFDARAVTIDDVRKAFSVVK